MQNPTAELVSPATRRLFIGVAGAAGASYLAALGYPVYRYLASPVELSAGAAAVSEVALKDAQKLAPGSVLMFKFGAAPALLIHHADGEWVALGAVCTHLGCTVQYQPARNRIYCACHGGTYDPRTGANTGGPPPRPLKRFNVKVTPDAVLVSRA
jgi:cytochrome b6-f complex iron-sulfur subunit